VTATPDPRAQGGFAALAELARAEHALILDGRFDELDELGERRAVVLAALPDHTPPEAVPHLREAARVQALVTVALSEARERVAAEIGRLGRTRQGAQGYAAAGTPQAGVIDAAG
jgi:hypothetical protein